MTRAKSPTGRLTENHYDLLTYLLVRGGALELIDWSPSAYLEAEEKAPSDSQIVILSKRLTTLVDRGLAVREGRKAKLTFFGRKTLIKHARESDYALLPVIEAAETHLHSQENAQNLFAAENALLDLWTETVRGEQVEGFTREELENTLRRMQSARELFKKRQASAAETYLRLVKERKSGRP